jgi:2-polyprenyl-3-methyl-5-hydroxy-6-metoxy-1,4-benzoquinol methylase
VAYSYEFYKPEIREYLKSKFKGNAKILDIGAGCGTYWNLLHNDFKYIDAVEVFKPNIEKYNLKQKYHRVYNMNIKDFEYGNYDIIIFGDIIEHLDINDAQNVLKYALNRCKEIIVAVPYEMEQEEVDGNIYEIHKQDDLTKKIMKERYPYLKLLYSNELYGYYVKGE